MILQMVRASLVFLALLLSPQESTEAERRCYVEKHVDAAIEQGLRALREMQYASGSFASAKFGGFPHGTTALALYTLLACGGTLEDPAASKALDWLLKNPIDSTGNGNYDTYEISLIAVALSYSLPHLAKGVRRNATFSMLQGAADWLASAQRPGGGWGYNLNSTGRHDHSNSQFAVLGLRAAVNAGAKVRREVWDREVTHYKTSQLGDGGWGYRACYKDRVQGSESSTSTMTAAGVMGLAMALGSTKALSTKQIASDPGIKKGLEAMKFHWDQGLTHKLKSLGGVPYLLYSVERACMVTGQGRLGNIDWYVEGVWLLINQQGADGVLGSFPRAGGRSPIAAHCFSLLFLKRAFVPVETPSRHKPGTPTPTGGTPSDTSGGKPREME